ncbi:MAG: hypothetical protein KDK70_40360, partial [Myxococcales bacterium]|nr:hypothetical protein [Myxococcales bacterium]
NLEAGRGAHPRLETMIRLATGLDVALSDLVACVDPWLTDERKAAVGAAHMWLAALDEPGRDLVLALVRVLTHGPTFAAERRVVYAA